MADKTCRAALLLAALALTGCSQGHSQPATPSPAPLAVDPVQLSEVLDGALTPDTDGHQVDAAYRAALTDLGRRCVEHLTLVYSFLTAAQREVSPRCTSASPCSSSCAS